MWIISLRNKEQGNCKDVKKKMMMMKEEEREETSSFLFFFFSSSTIAIFAPIREYNTLPSVDNTTLFKGN